MPSLFDETTLDGVFNRIHNLRPDTAARWGRMNAALMLQHCRIITEAIMQSQQPVTQRPTLQQGILRMLILNGIVKIPQGRPMPKHIADKMAQAGDADFAAEKGALMDALAAFNAFRGTMNGAHPRFGAMSHRDWGRFAWVHLDHHLRQFGV